MCTVQLIQEEVEAQLAEEDLRCKQHAKQHWLLHGYINTKFHHMYANQRRETNSISKIMDPTGKMIIDQAQISDVFIEFFTKLFTSSNLSIIESCLCGMNSKVIAKMNSKLMRSFSELEVKEVIFQMTPFSSPRPNGFSAHFYQTNWDTTGEEVYNFSLQVLNQGATLKNVNAIFINLIPKTKEPKNVVDYRLISLCNII